jgi:hypothetical protein
MYMAVGLFLDYLTEGASELLRNYGINIRTHVNSYRKRPQYPLGFVTLIP